VPCGVVLVRVRVHQAYERAGGGFKGYFQQQQAAWAECTCAGARIGIPLSFSVARAFCLPHAARRVAAHRSAMQGLGKWALCHSSPPPIQFTLSNTFTLCDLGPCSQTSMSLLSPWRLEELGLLYCLLSRVGQRAPIYLLYTTCRSLSGKVAPALAVSFLASFFRSGTSYV
jgi:hypothetical protein